jgi:putative flippase GtrA
VRPIELLRFALVGLVGFGVDGGILQLLMAKGQGLVLSRLLSFAAAVTATWGLNRAWTFSAPDRVNGHKGREYLAYFAVQLVGAAINLGCFFLVLAVYPAQRATPWVPLFVGAVPALMFNFAAAKYLVFRSR